MNVYMLLRNSLNSVPKTKWALNSSSKAPSEVVARPGMAILSMTMKKPWRLVLDVPTARRYG